MSKDICCVSIKLYIDVMLLAHYDLGLGLLRGAMTGR